ncbi:Vitamin B12-dependent ribonucleoside-diphosphate reductase [Aquicella siphonis]|uniref:Vitamin B12-dependent ribonucleotide reductase n=2 Tax=Aquicella siphonis TaxID=254247 RepID=A0A5E4PJH7_9COXI|nr:Vitamin B12-dependent ribonucleoside-diphosphate reductase [Aquicella siphonis]
MKTLNEPISMIVWENKYRYQCGGKIVDQSVEDTWRRVARAMAGVERKPERREWQRQFYRILENFHFLPGGRILAGAGTRHKVTLFNCFVMNIASDSLTGIFDALEEGALTLQQGGGVGYDFSVLRPFGDTVKKTGIQASGPVSFMRIWDAMCGVLLSTGTRRGAMMGVLRCDHPDIEAFITAKEDPRELRHFNVSVMVSDDFMAAVKNDAEWQLVFPVETEGEAGRVVFRQWGSAPGPVPCRIYRTLRARDLWEKIIRSAYEYAEPGVLFSDTINRMNNLWYCERIAATNPCGEIPLPPYGACDLGAVNLTQFVTAPFSAGAAINWNALEETVRVATRFLDNVIEVSRYPLRAQRQQAFATRRIGLGVTGLADMLIMMGIRYGSPESLAFARDVMKRVADATWQTSIELAHEKGVFPAYARSYLQGRFVQSLDASLRAGLDKFGVRNSHHNTIAPTGTISLLANNVSNGIEPVFRAEYIRHMRMRKGDAVSFRVQDYAYYLWRSNHPETDSLPPGWMDTDTLPPAAHLQVQAAVQPHIDNAISKTINIPRHFPFEQLIDVYSQAYALGLKGCTVFRPNPVTGSVIEVPEEHCCQYDGENALQK